MTQESWKVDKWRVAQLIACVVVSTVTAYFAEPCVRGSSEAIMVLTTVITVFAGFMVAIIAIIGDPALIPTGSWMIAENRRDAVKHAMTVHSVLFVVYLVAIGALFVGVVIRGVPDADIPVIVKIWVNRAYLFLGVASFILTFSLPFTLQRIQQARFDSEIEARRQAAGIKPS